MLYSVYAVLGGCCTQCMLYSVHAVLGVCCTWCMRYSVSAVLGVNSWLWHREIGRDDIILCSATMLELWTRNRGMGDEDVNDLEDMSRYDKSGVRLTRLSSEDIVLVLLHAGLGLVPAVLAIVNYVAQELLISPSFWWWYCPSPLTSQFLNINCTIT